MATRFLSLDVFRGITIAGMILVSDGGDQKYPILEHAAWDGWTIADLVFPLFVFIVGVTIAFSLSRRHDTGQSGGKLVLHVLRRTIILFLLGIIYYIQYFAGLTSIITHLRIMGVLQRIALVYFFTSIIVMFTGRRAQIGVTAFLLALYWALMKLVPVPGFGAGVLTREGNLAGYIDNIFLKGHLYAQTWDPEGLLHTIPAIATGLLGALAGHWLREKKELPEKIAGLLIAGNILVVLGFIVNPYFPINKNLWSPSFVLLTGGFAMILLAFCVWLIDFKGKKTWPMPFVFLGANSLLTYFLSGLLGDILSSIPVTKSAGKTVYLWDFVYHNILTPIAGPLNGSLLFSLLYIVLWMALMSILYRKKIFVKV